MTISTKKNAFPLSTNSKLKKEKINLALNDIHLWTTKPHDLALNINENTDQNNELLLKYHALLTPEESKKQQRYKFTKDRHDALITRAFIRDLLSYYAEVLPQDWRFDKGEKDKPEIVNPPLPLRFNISHTKNLIICAVTLNDDIGCDVENIGRTNDVLAIAERYFSPQETTELFSLPTAEQRNRFFDYWTLKESYIKAWGLGLAIPLADFSFAIFDKETDKETDKSAQQQGNFNIKNDIHLSFAKHRADSSEVWRSWLFYPIEEKEEPKEQHRIAISLRAKNNNQAIDYQLRFFNSIPLLGYQELS